MTSDATVIEAKVSEYHEKLSELWDIVMGIEMQLVDQLEETIKEFERNLADLITSFVEYVQGLYPFKILLILI